MLSRRDSRLPEKVNKILNVILVALLLITLRIWHLAVIQYDEKLEQSRKPQHRTVLEPAKRGTIRDRFNQPMAVNSMKYNAAILYSELRQIPSIAWEIGEGGIKVKKAKRKNYIASLAQCLGKELHLDPKRVEDLIHAKASFYYHMPFVLKEDISEQEYYRLKMMEKDWLGIHVQHLPRRSYPLGKVGGDIIGYMGAINRDEYERFLHEITFLENFLEANQLGIETEMPMQVASIEEAENRLKLLREQAYSLNDTIGKSGIEGSCESILRGHHGKKTYYSDAKGNFLRELEGSRAPLSGQRILLTISAELQEFAEKILIQNEKIRLARISTFGSVKQTSADQHQPWIKGGAIVVLDPNTGEILALASYPRFDPNDFITTAHQEIAKEKKERIGRWLESDQQIADIWDQKRPLERERCDGGKKDDCEMIYEEALPLTWDNFLQRILPKEHPVLLEVRKVGTIGRSIALQNHVAALLATVDDQIDARLVFNAVYQDSDQIPFSMKAEATSIKNSLKSRANEVEALKKALGRHFDSLALHYDKLLLVDLCRLAVSPEGFDAALLEKKGRETMHDYRQSCASKLIVEEVVKTMAVELFREVSFKPWREENEREFLKKKRVEEKIAKTYQKPYIDYLDAQELGEFKKFWEQWRWHLLLTFLTGHQTQQSILHEYEKHFATWHLEIAQGAHSEISWIGSYFQLQKAIVGLGPELTIQYFKTMHGYKELNKPLLGKYRALRSKDKEQTLQHLAASFYPKWGFGYGRSQTYRQAAAQGSIFKLVTAYAGLMQRYSENRDFPWTAEELNPLAMVDQNHQVGKQTFIGYDNEGNSIPRLYKAGRLPRSPNRKGKLDLLKALEISSNPYFSLIAGDVLRAPEDLARVAEKFSYGAKTGIALPAEISGQIPDDLATNRTGLYATAIGQHTLVVTPIQTALMLSALANGGRILHPQIIRMLVETDVERSSPIIRTSLEKVRWEVSLPPLIRQMLLEGMRRVVRRTQQDSLVQLSRIFRDYPEAISDYIDLKEEFVGKTSTAEIMENMSLDYLRGTNLYKHVWFAGIAFEEGDEEKPEIVVVVYLRFGAYGKEAAPLAAQVVKKWRSIKAKQKQS